ncbi:LysE family translocator [Paludibacterium yongneupense]|uniref:LysE family translocator n=1 Tax=Paludibacterium yongneupense TaxID=400061 RepID=UPI00041F90E8|nr:LysE family translocator [Paludibacterium yongneupense]
MPVPLAFVSYMGAMSITPGPNNIMLATSGVNFGFRRTVPHMVGISTGCALQLFLCAILLNLVMARIEAIHLPLTLAGCGYMLWLSWKLVRSPPPGRVDAATPMSFAAAALFQWVNPKAWVMVINSAVLFMPASGGALSAAGELALAALAVNLPCIAIWAFGGDSLRHCLQDRRALRAFNLLMAALLGATAIGMIVGEWPA